MYSLYALGFKFILLLPTPTAVEGVGFLQSLVCLFVFPHAISNSDAARITKPDIQMFHDESSKSNYFGSEGQRSRSRVTKTILSLFFALE